MFTVWYIDIDRFVGPIVKYISLTWNFQILNAPRPSVPNPLNILINWPCQTFIRYYCKPRHNGNCRTWHLTCTNLFEVFKTSFGNCWKIHANHIINQPCKPLEYPLTVGLVCCFQSLELVTAFVDKTQTNSAMLFIIYLKLVSNPLKGNWLFWDGTLCRIDRLHLCPLPPIIGFAFPSAIRLSIMASIFPWLGHRFHLLPHRVADKARRISLGIEEILSYPAGV